MNITLNELLAIKFNKVGVNLNHIDDSGFVKEAEIEVEMFAEHNNEEVVLNFTFNINSDENSTEFLEDEMDFDDATFEFISDKSGCVHVMNENDQEYTEYFLAEEIMTDKLKNKIISYANKNYIDKTYADFEGNGYSYWFDTYC